MGSKFYLAGSNDSRSSLSSNASDLPFPSALPRSDFLETDFNPSAYLSSLGHRHQTLEDLRAELRTRSQLLSQELLDLVNAHYVDFLGLGSSLKGGPEKIEELKVGLLGFRREIEGIRRDVVTKEAEISSLLLERKSIAQEQMRGRQMLDFDHRLSRLEDKSMLVQTSYTTQLDLQSDSSSVESEDDEKTPEEGSSSALDARDSALSRLSRMVNDYSMIKGIAKSIGEDHPFVVVRQRRMREVRNMLLADLRTLLKRSSRNAVSSFGFRLKEIEMLRHLNAEAVK